MENPAHYIIVLQAVSESDSMPGAASGSSSRGQSNRLFEAAVVLVIVCFPLAWLASPHRHLLH